jgi:hypothetical protein
VDLAEYLSYFMKSDAPFMLLFVSLFFYTVKSNKEREAHLNKLIDKRLSSMQEELRVLMEVWKILLEKELKTKQEAEK